MVYYNLIYFTSPIDIVTTTINFNTETPDEASTQMNHVTTTTAASIVTSPTPTPLVLEVEAINLDGMYNWYIYSPRN